MAPLPIKNQKRPNTITNNPNHEGGSGSAPHSSGSLGLGGLGNQRDK